MENMTPEEEISLKELLRKLFTDHAVYTKFFIESTLNDSPDANSIAKRLFANQNEIGANVGTIIGTNNGTMLANLLKQHIQFAADAVVAAKNNMNLSEEKDLLFSNSAEVAKFISDLNKEVLPYNEVKKQFDQHNTYVLEMVELHLGKQYDNEVKKYDEYYNHMLTFSDMLHRGLTPQNTVTKQSSNWNMMYTIIFILILLIFSSCFYYLAIKNTG